MRSDQIKDPQNPVEEIDAIALMISYLIVASSDLRPAAVVLTEALSAAMEEALAYRGQAGSDIPTSVIRLN